METAIIEESSSIRAYPLSNGRRRIVFDVRLRALRSGVQLAGTDDADGAAEALRAAQAATDEAAAEKAQHDAIQALRK